MKFLITNTSTINLLSFARIKLSNGYRVSGQTREKFYIDLCYDDGNDNIVFFTYDDKYEQLEAYKEILDFIFNSEAKYLDWHNEDNVSLNDILLKNNSTNL